MEFSGKTIIVTGAASGMGLVTCERLAAQGAHVALLDVNEKAVVTVAKRISSSADSVLPIVADVRNYDQISSVIDLVTAKFGRIDVVINYAGGSSARVHNIPGTQFHDLPINVLDWGIDVNFRGPIYLAHAVMGEMISQKSGVIVNIGSIDGETGSGAVEYSASKSGIMYGLTKSLAKIGAPYGIRAVCVTPGPVMTRPAMANMKTALGRASQPDEIVDLVLFVASSRAGSITGTNYIIDCGRNAMFY